MRLKISKKLFVVFLALFLSTLVIGQEFSLDDDPTAPATCPIPVPGFFSAEDEFGFLGIALGPSPSLLHWNGPFLDSDHLVPGPWMSFPIPPLCYVDAACANHINMVNPHIGLRFSIDRITGGIPGSASFIEAGFNQQSGDIYDTTVVFLHPVNFAGALPPAPPPPNPPYVGILPTAGVPGASNILFLDESFFGLTAGWGIGVLVPPGVMCPPAAPFTHDNIDSYNDFPGPMINFDSYYALHPAEGVITGFSGADVFWFPAGGPGFLPPPYAPAGRLGLDRFNGFPNPNTDSIDALVVWDYGIPGVLEPVIDFALFSLAPGSATLTALQAAGVPADAGSIFFTDFTGVFAIYAFSSDLGLTNNPGPNNRANADALEVF